MKKNNKNISYTYYPDECFYCGLSSEVVGLTEHHIYPGYADRKNSPTIYLCQTCHDKCHMKYYSSEFKKKIQYLYHQKYGERPGKGN